MNITKLKAKLQKPRIISVRDYKVKPSLRQHNKSIYIAKRIDDNWYKMGISNSPMRRVYKDFGTYVANGCELIESMDLTGDVYGVEQRVINTFRSHLKNNDQYREWIKLDGSTFKVADTFRLVVKKVVLGIQRKYAYNQSLVAPSLKRHQLSKGVVFKRSSDKNITYTGGRA
jgi:hypothetical protein